MESRSQQSVRLLDGVSRGLCKLHPKDAKKRDAATNGDVGVDLRIRLTRGDMSAKQDKVQSYPRNRWCISLAPGKRGRSKKRGVRIRSDRFKPSRLALPLHHQSDDSC
jgi:hypothetical protein